MKILAAIASYGAANDEYLKRLIAEYRSMSHVVDIVVLSNLSKDWIQGAEIKIGLPTRDPWSLPFAHKQVFAERLNNYDLFIYSEDDTLITERNINAFLKVLPELPADEIPGFLRFELASGKRVNYPEFHGNFHWNPGSVCRRGGYVVAQFSCEHSASYLLTQQQLRRAIDSNGFLVAPHRGKYDMACTASTDPYTQCGFKKVVCVSHVDDFLVHHLPNKYVDTRFGIDEAEFRRQIQSLLRIAENKNCASALFPTETTLRDGEYSKDYYEPAREEVISQIPQNAGSVLSIGCGSGRAEASLVEKGIRVVAVPLDSVISGAATGKGIAVVEADFQKALEKLSGEQFDCLLLQNVLQFLPDPTQFLSSYERLLSKDAVVIALLPNLSSITSIWRGIRIGEVFKRRRGYESTGVQFIRARLVRNWFERTGMRIEQLRTVGRSSGASAGRSFLGPFLNSEFIVVARKSS